MMDRIAVNEDTSFDNKASGKNAYSSKQVITTQQLMKVRKLLDALEATVAARHLTLSESVRGDCVNAGRDIGRAIIVEITAIADIRIVEATTD